LTLLSDGSRPGCDAHPRWRPSDRLAKVSLALRFRPSPVLARPSIGRAAFAAGPELGGSLETTPSIIFAMQAGDPHAQASRSRGVLADVVPLGDTRAMDPSRLIRVDSAVFADALFLIGQAWVKRAAGDVPGAAADLAAAMRLLPEGGVELITGMIEGGDLPEPSQDPDGMDAWLERCRQAGAGDLRLTVVRAARPVPAPPPPPQVESEADFLKRLSQIRADAEARQEAARARPASRPR
jgi:hypothetical protein